MDALIPTIDARRPGADSEIAALRAKLATDGNVVSEAGRAKTIEVFGEALTPVQVVQRICNDVQRNGLDAVLDYTAKLDGAELTPDELRVGQEELTAAHAQAAPDFLVSIRHVRENLLRFQSAILHEDVSVDLPRGGALRQRYLPLRRVGICVPGGAAAYPSTVLMTAVPAQAAGVEQLAVVAPPTPFGSYNTDLLATCHELGITEVYRMGGAQAVAALAYGAQGVPQVDKIVGPGNLFVALAKRHVFGTVDIDSIAGPSEVIVVADASTPARYAAADLVAQAEHSPGSAILVTWHEPLLKAVEQQLAEQLAVLDRSKLTRQALADFGALILVEDRQAAAQLCDNLATEHLHIACEEAEAFLAEVRCAGAVFLGPYSPVPVGDYVAGPSHVLPTGATARFASGLSSNDFLRSNSVIAFSANDLRAEAEHIVRIAEKESLTGHARAVKLRLEETDHVP